MTKELIFSLNTVLPLIILIGIGYIIRISGILNDVFFTGAEKFVFKVALPCSLFMSVYGANSGETFSKSLIIFCVTAIAAVFILPCLIVPLFIKENPVRGAFIQGTYRSNFAIFGLPLADRLFPETGKAAASSVMPFAIPMFNIFAVVILSVFAPVEKKQSVFRTLRKCLFGIVTNPLIIGIVLALPFMIFSVSLPEPLTATVSYIGDIATPLALICLGATLNLKIGKNKILLALLASVIKVAVIPTAVLAVAVALGYRSVDLGIILILFGSPTAVSSYIMAKNMGSDSDLAAQILVMSTVLCSLTLFIAIFLLAHFSYISVY